MSGVIVETPSLEATLKDFFGDDGTPELWRLVRIAVAVHEHAFSKISSKEEILALAGGVCDALRSEDTVKKREKMIETFRTVYGQTVSSRVRLSVIQILSFIEEHLIDIDTDSGRFGITKKKLLEWLARAWDAGASQRRVYDMEVEGSVANSFGVAANFAAHLALLGRQEGFLTVPSTE